MWITRHGASHSHSDVKASSAQITRTYVPPIRAIEAHGDIKIFMKDGVRFENPIVITAAEAASNKERR